MSAVGTQQKQAVTVGPNRISTEKNQAAFVANSQGAAVLENSEKIAVEQVGTKVIINGYYNRTNHYIHCSRDFVGGAKLTRYINFPALIALSVLAMLVSLAAPAFFLLAFLMAGIDLAWFCIFVQHMYVNVRTMPHMLRLPRVPDNMLRSNNGFFEISLEKYTMMFGVQAQAGIGIIIGTKGTIKLHILTDKAVCYMKTVMVYSTFALLATFALMIYCTVFGIANLVAGGGIFRVS